jgi:hypothetical protein
MVIIIERVVPIIMEEIIKNFINKIRMKHLTVEITIMVEVIIEIEMVEITMIKIHKEEEEDNSVKKRKLIQEFC